MEVTKCDRCGSYVDVGSELLPQIVYRGARESTWNDLNKSKVSLCPACYNRFLDWVKPFDREEKRQSWE